MCNKVSGGTTFPGLQYTRLQSESDEKVKSSLISQFNIVDTYQQTYNLTNSHLTLLWSVTLLCTCVFLCSALYYIHCVLCFVCHNA